MSPPAAFWGKASEAHLERVHVDSFASLALQPQHDLLCGHGLLVENRLSLTSIPRLLAVVSPLPCVLQASSHNRCQVSNAEKWSLISCTVQGRSDHDLYCMAGKMANHSKGRGLPHCCEAESVNMQDSVMSIKDNFSHPDSPRDLSNQEKWYKLGNYPGHKGWLFLSCTV